ncbi:MAG: hypothetical protein JNL32_12855 [Candidatus Kapabacteria bacterium]|nr:hypothetical protein [Candidatus Kapabacteria bacterium]
MTVASKPAKKSDCPCGCGGNCGGSKPRVQHNDCPCGCGGACGCNDGHHHHHGGGYGTFPFVGGGFPFMPMNLNINNSPTTTSNRSETVHAPVSSSYPVVATEEPSPIIVQESNRIGKRILQRVYDSRPVRDTVVVERVADNPLNLEPIAKKKVFKVHTVPTWY